ncbi:MAG: chromate efflux transporter [Chloroflexi bacterium]|nr:chromate efflux transporter [Chloroflexota bacterium]
MPESPLAPPSPPEQTTISFRDAFWVWVRVAIYSFGGPAGQMAVMHKILVEEKRWVGEDRFLHALNFTMLLPGPEAQQLATYIGWLLHSTKGGLVAGTLFVIPGFLSILGLSILYAGYQEVSLVQALFYGLKPAVMAVVVDAVFRIGKRTLSNRVMIAIAALAFIAIFFFKLPFPLIIFLAGLTGFIGGRMGPANFTRTSPAPLSPATDPQPAAPAHTRPSGKRALRVLVVSLVLWFAPIVAAVLLLGPDNIFVTIGLFFSKTAVVTFGGAYAVLAYIAQQAVDVYGWLQPGQMLDGLGMAETTPGPLIQVVQFVGFLAAYQNPGNLNPVVAGVLASILTTWVTFVPCFLWIFLGAPYIENLRGNRNLSAALSAITAAVVGVILNLALWFSLQTVFTQVNQLQLGPLHLQIPVWQSVDIVSLLIAIAAFVALFRFKAGMIQTLAGSALVGLLYYLVFLI